MTKSFVVLMVIFVVIGASIGGAFAGGVALGKKQQDEAPTGAFGVPAGVPNFAAAGQASSSAQASSSRSFHRDCPLIWRIPRLRAKVGRRTVHRRRRHGWRH